MAQQTEDDENRTADKKFTAATDADGLATELDRENPLYCLAEGDEVTLVYDSPYTDAEETTWTGTVDRTGTSRGGLTTFEVQGWEGTKKLTSWDEVRNYEGRMLGELIRVEAARPQDITEMLEAAAEDEDEDEQEAEDEDGGEGSALTCDVEWCGGVREGTTGYCSQHQDEAEQEDEDEDVSTELKEAVNSAKGTALAYGSSAPHAKQAEDGRWFVKFSTSHGYGRSNALEAAREVLPEMEMAYNPHGAKQWLAERYDEDRMERDEARDLVQEGLVYVNPRGYTARITEVKNTGSIRAEYPNSELGDSRTEPREGRLVDLLVDGICTVLEDPRLGEDNTQQPDVAEDGGQVDEAENPHRHRGVWSAALNLETHEDGRAPHIGVEYRKKNGNGTARKAGTVERVEVQRPDKKMGHEVGQPVPRIAFTRDDGQRMYVEPDGLYTVGSHAPFMGAIVALTTSTTSTVDVPEASHEGEDSTDDGGDSSPQVRAPQVDNLEDLAEWVERQGSDLHAEVGTTHYSWDIPGFGRSNDPHNGRTAKRDADPAYLVVRGPRSERVEKALALLAHQEDLECSTSSHRATLVPPQGW